LALIA